MIRYSPSTQVVAVKLVPATNFISRRSSFFLLISFSSLILFLLFIPAALSGASSLIFYTLLAYVITGVIAVRFVKSDFSKLSQKGQSLLLSFPIAIFLFAAYIFLS